MTRALSYIGFTVACLFVILLFVTSKSYVQLTIAIILYPIITFLALKIFPRKVAVINEYPSVTVAPNTIPNNVGPVNNNVSAVMPSQKVDIIDVDKRTFLKFIGTAGISFFIFSLLGASVGVVVAEGVALITGSDVLDITAIGLTAKK